MSGHSLWGGRFDERPEAAFDRLNRSLPVDRRMWREDIRAARAWVGALAAAGLLTDAEAAELRSGLDRVSQRVSHGDAEGASDEDVHTLVERLLYDEVGPLAGKLNTGRSRNDQVATDLRLWTIESLRVIDRETRALGAVLVTRARREIDLVMPGYTHQQRAQPVRWSYVLLAHAWPLTRDLERIAEAAARAAFMPLGSGALAGSGVPVERTALATELGFRGIVPNALDATGDRDFAADAIYALTMLATHLSRLAGEMISYCSAEYGFVRLSDGYSSGSSLMPQKKNPDVFELARAKAARVAADLHGLIGTLHGLHAGYAKDLQEDKHYLFDAVDTLELIIPAVRGAMETLEPVPARMSAALDQAMLATDIAERMAASGVPFREAHAVVGQLVRAAEELGLPLLSVHAERMAALHPRLCDAVSDVGTWENSIENRATRGASSRDSVMEQMEALERLLLRP